MDDIRRLDLGTLIFGLAVVFVGGYYLLRNTFGFDLGDLNWDAVWPAIIVAVGASILIRASGVQRSN